MTGQQEEMDLGERYDIFTDTMRPVNKIDLAAYEATMLAYSRVRLVTSQIHGYLPLVAALNAIHDDLKRRISEPS